MTDKTVTTPPVPVLLVRGAPSPITEALAVRYPAQHRDLDRSPGRRPSHADRGERAIVTSLRLRDATGTGYGAAHELRREIREVVRLARELPELRHVIVLLEDLSSSPRRRSAWHTVAERLHARFEQDCGAYVTVTVLLTVECTESDLLARRIWERVAAEAPDPAVALNWQECLDRPITLTAMNLYV